MGVGTAQRDEKDMYKFMRYKYNLRTDHFLGLFCTNFYSELNIEPNPNP